MVPFLFPYENVAPESDHEHSLPCLWASSGIFFTLQSTVSSHMVHLGQHAAVGCWHTPGDSVTHNTVFHGEEQGNTTTNHWKTCIVSTYPAKEWKDCSSDPRKDSAMSNKRAALLCLTLLFAACAALQSEYVISWDHSSSPNYITSPGLQICFAISSVTDELDVPEQLQNAAKLPCSSPKLAAAC